MFSWMRPRPDTRHAMSFLGWMRDGGPWVLIACKGRDSIEARLCSAADAPDFIAAHTQRGRVIRVLLGDPAADYRQSKDVPPIMRSNYVGLAVDIGRFKELEALARPSIWIMAHDHVIAAWRFGLPTKLDVARAAILAFGAEFGGKILPETIPVPLHVVSPGLALKPGEFARHSFRFDRDAIAYANTMEFARGPAAKKVAPADEDDEEFVRGDQAKIRRPPTLKTGWIPAEAFTLFVGRPKRGKSLAVAKMAAYITAGGVWFDGEPVTSDARGSVIIIEEEDSREETLARCKAAGCDMSKVHVRVRVPDISSEAQLKKVTDFAEKLGDCRMISFSPLQSAIPSADYNESVVRAKFRPILRWARGKRIALVGVIHLDKEGKHVAGSDVIVRACRSGLSFDDHPDDKRADEFARRRVMRIMFSNVGKMGTMIPYDTEGATVTVGGEKIPTARMVFSSAQTATQAGVVNGEASAHEAPKRRHEPELDVYRTLTAPMQNCVRFLMTFFQSRYPATTDRVLEAGRQYGVRDGGTLYRACEMLSIERRVNGSNKHALWVPPAEWPAGFERVQVIST